MILGVEARLLGVVLASYGAISTAASLVLAAAWRRALPHLAVPSPRVAADRILLIRILPCLLGTGGATTAAIAFLLFEPPLPREKVGLPFLFVATAGAALLLAAARRGVRSARATAAVTRSWSAGSPATLSAGSITVRQVISAFPVVAASGLWRPRLLVARSVADACSEAELEAILAHERAHLTTHDNLRQAVLTLCPDLFGWLPACRRLERSWREATERAADEAATRGDEGRRLALASALVKVARMAVGQPIPTLPGNALFRGEPIAERVRSLLAPSPTATTSGSSRFAQERSGLGTTAALLFLSWILVTLFSAMQPELFAILEGAIRLGR